MHTYEKNCLTYEEAQEVQAITGGRITTFLSTGNDGEQITIYCVKYKQLF